MSSIVPTRRTYAEAVKAAAKAAAEAAAKAAAKAVAEAAAKAVADAKAAAEQAVADAKAAAEAAKASKVLRKREENQLLNDQIAKVQSDEKKRLAKEAFDRASAAAVPEAEAFANQACKCPKYTSALAKKHKLVLDAKHVDEELRKNSTYDATNDEIKKDKYELMDKVSNMIYRRTDIRKSILRLELFYLIALYFKAFKMSLSFPMLTAMQCIYDKTKDGYEVSLLYLEEEMCDFALDDCCDIYFAGNKSDKMKHEIARLFAMQMDDNEDILYSF
jgi:hypothetical protein